VVTFARRGHSLVVGQAIVDRAAIGEVLAVFRSQSPGAALGVFGPFYRRGQPYIYSRQEIASLLKAASTLPPPQSLLPASFKTLLGLLACAGLRISEALHLQTHDFDAHAGTLLIRKSKGGQSRYVPLKPSAVAALKKYLRLRQKHYPLLGQTALFLTGKGRPLSYRKAGKLFPIGTRIAQAGRRSRPTSAACSLRAGPAKASASEHSKT